MGGYSVFHLCSRVRPTGSTDFNTSAVLSLKGDNIFLTVEMLTLRTTFSNCHDAG
jgi:hypothetical protein